jgi:hypothetical protein
MRNTKKHTKQIEKLSRTNFKIICSVCGLMFSYLILLGLTATNIVTTKSLSKVVDDKKTELATVELDYMKVQNIVALESVSNTDFMEAKNVSYVNEDGIASINSVAYAEAKR